MLHHVEGLERAFPRDVSVIIPCVLAKAGTGDLPDEFLNSTEETKRSFGAFW